MTGIESMFATLLKAMGFDPAVVVRQIQDFATNLQSTLAQVDAKFNRVETKIDRVLDKLDTISPQIPPPSCERDETMSPIVVPFSVTLEHKEAA